MKTCPVCGGGGIDQDAKDAGSPDEKCYRCDGDGCMDELEDDINELE